MFSINTEKFKKAGFSFEEIESIKAGILDIKEERVSNENEVFERLQKKISSHEIVHV